MPALPAVHGSSARRRAARLLSIAAVWFVGGCGGSDPLPTAGVEDRTPLGGVTVAGVEGAAFDGVSWLTREDAVTARGQAPNGSIVEAKRDADGQVAGSAGVDGNGRYAVRLPVVDRLNLFDLRARRGGVPPGPPTIVRVFRRTTPPDPFGVDPVPVLTGATALAIQGPAEADIDVIVRVEGGLRAVEARKPTGQGRFALDVPLLRDRQQVLSVSGQDLAGNRTAPVVLTVTQDSSAPPPPTLDSVPGPLSASGATLTGRAPGAARVDATTPDGRVVSAGVEADGRFGLALPLEREGENRFDVSALDAVGNRSGATSAVIVRDTIAPDAPSGVRVLDQSADASPVLFVVDPDLTITGRAEPGSTVEASGEGLFATTQAAPATGDFRLEVRLPGPGRLVPIRVEAIDAAGNRGAPAAFTVYWAGF